MKISSIQQVIIVNKMRLLVLFCFLMFINEDAFSQGKALFEGRCNSCHQIDKNGTGPMLKGAKKRWADANEKDLIVEWVINNEALRASKKSKRALEIYNEYNKSPMTVFSELTPKQVNEILDYVDAEAAKGAAGADKSKDKGTSGATDESKEEGSGSGTLWYVIAVLFLVIILSVGGVRRQLQVASSGNEELNKLTYWEEIKQLLWKYRKTTAVSVLVLVLSLVVYGFNMLYSINIMEGYQPSQPIAFPHDKHAGLNGIDCKYCHNSVAKSKSAGLPTVNVCMNCHKQINGKTEQQQAEIAKIYAAAGWNPNLKPAGGYTGNTKPIVWNKVHVLPDHVYFNHSQHVTVGGIDCKQCHGDMTKQNQTARVTPVSDINKLHDEDDKIIQLTKPTLTMGWCIECHGKKKVEIGNGKNAYYDEIHSRLMKNKALYKQYLKGDQKITASELGGWECAKCHY
ncbi:MAG: c-type cytochrome [Flavobacteriales bacterium]